jgi:phosphoribosylformimino-5-aminoimidazole carboxamide ribotide isomerase
MLIPSIDLMDGRVVQLEQGERLRVASDDLQGWIDRFRGFPVVQLIDLDAAKGRGDNAPLVAEICRTLPCQVGGGVRTIERAKALIALGARRVVIGSALYTDGAPDVARAQAFAHALGGQAFVAAVDARRGRVVTHGWRGGTHTTPADAVRALSSFAGAFLYTHVDTEGLLSGVDMDAVLAVRAATTKGVIAAGGIRSLDEVHRLDDIGVDAVVGMAIYTGLLDPGAALRARTRTGNGPGGASV